MSSEALAGLRDVGDVHGSFVLGTDGHLLARDLPGVFRDELFADVGPRLVRLRETLESNGPAMLQLVLRFAEHKLHVRVVGERFLCVLTGAKVNGPALRMATNLVAKRVEANTTPGDAPQRPSLTPPEPPPSPTTTSSAPPTHRGVLYRGRRPGF